MMMKYILVFLFGFGFVFAALAQNLFDDSSAETLAPTVSDEEVGSSLGIDQIKKSSENTLQPMNLFTNRFDSSGTPESSANDVKKSKVGFLMSTGLEYIDEGDYEAAERAYLRALEVNADDEDVLFRLGALYVTMERFTDAVEIFKDLNERFPDNAMANNNLAWCYATGAGVKNKTLALRHAREALLFAPLVPAVWNTLAEAYYVSGDYEKALRSADRALELSQAANTDEERTASFMEQRNKIILSKKAMSMMEGMDEED